MITHDELTDMMAARLSKEEGFGFDLYESRTTLFVLFLLMSLVVVTVRSAIS